MKRYLGVFIGFFLLFCLGIALADVPVVDLTQQTDQSQAQNQAANPPADQDNAQTSAVPSDTTNAASGDDTTPSVPAASNPSTSSSFTTDQRVARLETQMANITQMNLAARLDSLQQTLQQLQGQLDLESHSLKLLSEQQNSYYKDLNQRIAQLQGVGSTAGSNAASTEGKAATTSAPTTAAITAQEKKAYQTGFQLLTQKKYDDAVKSFQSYLSDYPTGKYAVNAHYWMAEVYYLQGKVDQAETEFNTVVTQYPTTQKVPDSLLKLVLIHVAANKTDQAKQELQKLKKDYPNTTAAKLAEQQLRGL